MKRMQQFKAAVLDVTLKALHHRRMVQHHKATATESPSLEHMRAMEAHVTAARMARDAQTRFTLRDTTEARASFKRRVDEYERYAAHADELSTALGVTKDTPLRKGRLTRGLLRAMGLGRLR